MAIFKITDRIRISSDGMNYIPEMLINSKNKEGQDIKSWKSYGYYSCFKNAILRLLEVYPINFAEEKDIKTMRDVLEELEILKEEIAVKIIKEFQ